MLRLRPALPRSAPACAARRLGGLAVVTILVAGTTTAAIDGPRVAGTVLLGDPAGCEGAPEGTPCEDGDACTTDDRCDGAGNCVGGEPAPCSDACQTGACDPATGCERRPAGTVCRPAAGDCDVAETCDGESDGCPADGFAAASLVCRPAVDPCDLDDRCLGTSPGCPTFDGVKTGFDAVTCAFDRSIDPPSCAGERVPPRTRRLFRKAGALVAAPSSSPRKSRARLCAALARLRSAVRLVERAAARRSRPVAEPCAADLRDSLGDAARRVESIAATCRR